MVQRIVYMIPKEAGVDVIEKQRPLKLQESLEKITVGIRKDRMARVWERLGVCDASQFAFLRGRSTIQPARIKRLLLERAKGCYLREQNIMDCLWLRQSLTG
jgi:hypothetical protein